MIQMPPPANDGTHPAVADFSPLLVGLDDEGLLAVAALAVRMHARNCGPESTCGFLVRMVQLVATPGPVSRGRLVSMRPFSGSPMRIENMDAIAAPIAKRLGVTMAQIKGPSRARHIGLARQEIMWALADAGRWSRPTIGAYLGGRDHSTITHGVHRHEQRMRDTTILRAEACG